MSARAFFRRLKDVLCSVAIAPIRLYQTVISPLLPRSCRFTPSCSQYCIEAIREWGIICGIGLGIYRILRCNPFCRGGYDPVPKRKKKKDNKPDCDSSDT